ncbi:MAG: murein transglycosylase A [Novosphingobium sp.]|nr:murein transglycosylase A [Novosphingobium sp.]
MRRGVAALAALALLGACVRVIPEAHPPPAVPLPRPAPSPPPPPTAALLGARPGPAVATLGLTPTATAPALAAFRASCPKLLARSDASGLTRNADWQAACAVAVTWPDAKADEFFAQAFETAIVGPGSSFVTGYYEPEIAGTRTHQPGFDVPVYKLPPDLVRCWPATVPPEQQVGNAPLGRIDETGQCVPYYDRAAIEAGALAGKNLELAWAADPIEFYFLQVQGSGRLRAPDGTGMRIGYAGQNGYAYTNIGAVLRDRGLIGTGPGQYPGSMQGIVRYLREHPDEGRALMDQNRSWVFFRELTGIDPNQGPVGALGVPVHPKVTVAADPAFVPLGAPVWLALDRAEASGLWVAQDTGGAIKGANRFDTFWGTGAEAAAVAGGMSGRGQALLLLPKGTLARLVGQ